MTVFGRKPPVARAASGAFDLAGMPTMARSNESTALFCPSTFAAIHCQPLENGFDFEPA
jgi:hypothetical protein